MPLFRISVHIVDPLIRPVLQSSRATPDLGCPDVLFLRHRKGKALSDTRVRDRAGYSESFWLSPSFSNDDPSSQRKLLKSNSVKSVLCRLDVHFCFPFEVEAERKWKGREWTLLAVFAGVVSYCFLLFNLVWLLRLDCEISRVLLMYLPAFQGFGAVLLHVLYLSEKKIFLLQFCVIYLEGNLLIFCSNKL